MPRLKISVITPSYNQGRFIERTIESVLQQAGDFEIEYLIMDGGSTDNTLEILRKYAGRITVEIAADDGQADAINKGLRRAGGEIVGWLNSDDLLAPGALQRVVEVFTRYPNVEWVHGRCDIVDADGRLIRPLISLYKHWLCRRYSFSRLLTENFISQMTVFWRRNLMKETGYPDQSLNFAFDYDYWLRLAQRSDPFYINDRQASFRWYQTSKSGSQFREQFREDYEVARRHAKDNHWILLHKQWKTARMIMIYRILSMFHRI